MRILIVGSNQPWAIERLYLKYLKELNPETYLFAAQNLLHQYLSSSILKKIYFRIGIADIYDKINKELIEYVENIEPEIVWVFKGMELLPKTLELFKVKGIKLVNYNPDHPFIISSRGSWNKNVFNSVGLYDLHLCYSKDLMKKINEDYKIKTEFLPFGFELDEDTYKKVRTMPENDRVCFIGNPDKIRVDVIEYLLNNRIEVDVYGHNWHRYFTNKKNIKPNIYDAVYADKFWTIARKYRVQLNIFRPHNIGSHNMRTFEIPAVGGIQLAPYSSEHREFFEEGKEIFLYKNHEELLKKVRLLLNINKEESYSIRTLAREKSLIADYTYKARANYTFQTFYEL